MCVNICGPETQVELLLSTPSFMFMKVTPWLHNMITIPGNISQQESTARPAAEKPCCNPKQGWQRIQTVTDVCTQYHVISLQADVGKRSASLS